MAKNTLKIRNNIRHAILAMKFKIRKPTMKNMAYPIFDSQFSPPIPNEPATNVPIIINAIIKYLNKNINQRLLL